MADNLTDTSENLLLDWLHGQGTPTRPTAPVMCALIDGSTPTDSTPGGEVSGGSYARQDANLGTASSGAVTNTSEIRFTDMPATTVTHVELWDSATTPVRLWHGSLSSSKSVNAGDDFVIPSGDLDLTLS